MDKKIKNRLKRRKHIRKKVFGTEVRPRMSVYRSNNHIYVQVIDDASGKTLAAASDSKSAATKKQTPIEKATETGKAVGEQILKLKIKQVVFDRGGYKYHGRVKALADGAREAGLVL